MHTTNTQSILQHTHIQQYLENDEGSMFANGSDEILVSVYKKYCEININNGVNKLTKIDS